MKNQTLTVLVVVVLELFVLHQHLYGQATQPAVPRQPLVPRLPASASWVVTYEYALDKNPPQAGVPARYLGEVPKKTIVTKLKDVYREQTLLSSGRKIERWDFAGTQFANSIDSDAVFLVAPPTEDTPNPDYADHHKSDFPELDWLSMELFRGVMDFRGQKAYAFEMIKDGRKWTAYLSPKDQKPLSFSDSASVRIYAFSAAPVDSLVPPANFMEAFNRHKKAMDALKYKPGLP